MPDERVEQVRALTFGSVAEQYERHRPDYPGELVDAVLAHAVRPVRAAVEVGAGTGKATRLFAARGIDVTAVEPDAGMAQVLEQSTGGLPVRLFPGTFEQYDADRPVDLLYAGAAWHWTDPSTRWSRAVELLAPGGVLALFGSPAEPVDPAVAAAIAEIEEQVLAPDDPWEVHPWTFEDLAAVDGLVDAVRRPLRRTSTTTRAQVLGRLGTVSAYLLLSPDARGQALRRVGAALPDGFELDTSVQLCLARRA